MHKVWLQFHLTQKLSAMFLVGGIVQFLAAVAFAGWGTDQAENFVFWGTISLCGSLASEVLWLMLFPLIEEKESHGTVRLLEETRRYDHRSGYARPA